MDQQPVLAFVFFLVVSVSVSIYVIRLGTKPLVEAIERLTAEVSYGNQRRDDDRREGRTGV